MAFAQSFSDPAEYALYKNAKEQTDAKAQAAAFEDFLKQYPDSKAKTFALKALIADYKKIGDSAKAEDAANRLAGAASNDLNAMVEVAKAKADTALQPKADQKAADDAEQFAAQGLEKIKSAAKPAGMSDVDFQKQKDKATVALEVIRGELAIKAKNYGAAQQHYQNAVNLAPDDLGNVYQLAKAYLDAPEPNYPMGIWYTARAATLAPDAKTKANYTQGAKDRYVKYHGSETGWPAVLKQASATAAPPADLNEMVKAGEAPKKGK